jgi:ubiquinone/menaquinone biosynthesis C-methylase UbiE
MTANVDFHYPWWLSYGHLMIAIPALLVWVWGRSRKWSKLPMFFFAAIAIWAFSSFLIARFVFNANAVPALPTQAFLPTGTGKILDMGAGTGRSSLMVLESRPNASVVALDLFTESYKHHFGTEMSGQERLAANFRAAGFENRTAIQAGDMRQLPFDAASFDAIVSSYAIDHLNRKGVDSSLREALRVLKPQGDMLLTLVANDFWSSVAFGPLLLHGGLHKADWWSDRLRENGFQIVEQGTKPITLYFLARKP